MKKQILLCLLALIGWSCSFTRGVYQTDNYTRLMIGMSKNEVVHWIGLPDRYLQAGRTPYGYEEVLLYRNRYNEYFALEFLNDYLVSADNYYDDIWYPMYPPYNRPPYGKPVFPPDYRPNTPYYPPGYDRPGNVRPPQEPTTRPPSSPRPPANNNRPASTERPSSGGTNSSSGSSRESNGNNSTRGR